MSSIVETPEIPDDEIAAPSTRDGSVRSMEGSHSNDLSSLSSIDAVGDQAEEQAPSLVRTEATSSGQPEQCPDSTVTGNRLLESATAPQNLFDVQFQNALSAFGLTHQAPLCMVLSDFQSLVNAETGKSLKSYRPTEMLFDTKPPWTFRYSSMADLTQMKDAADFFSAAGSDHDAFAFYGAICFQTTLERVSGATTSSVVRAAIDVTRTATSDSSSVYINWLVENHLSLNRVVVPASKAEDFLLHLHLGDYCRARGNIRQAEKMYEFGLAGYLKWKGYRNLSAQACRDGFEAVILINAKSVLEQEGYFEAPIALVRDISVDGSGPGDTLLGLLYGSAINLANDDFRSILNNASDALWEHAPTANDLVEFESTALFCYFWTRWQAGKSRSQSSHLAPYRHSRLADLENQTGIPPLEALSAISVLICHWLALEIDQGTPANRSTLPDRASERCRCASLLAPNVIYSAFLSAYTVSVRARGSRFSTENYCAMVSKFVRGFADSYLSIEIWQGFGEDPRSCKSHRSSVSSTLAPTMISTPRSSWSGYASFRSLHQRTKQNILGVGSDEPPSTSSGLSFSTESSSIKRRWSALTSRRSSRSSDTDMMEVDPEDIISLDDV